MRSLTPRIGESAVTDSPKCERSEHLLRVSRLVTSFPARGGLLAVVNDVSFCLHPNEVLGVVGETGSGKSMTMLSLMGLVPGRGRITGGDIEFQGTQLVGLPPNEYRYIRGREIGMIVQNARGALNPLERVGRQIGNVYKANTSLRGHALSARMENVLRSVGFRDADRILQAYPHQLSGGMAQRVLIAVALGPSPKVVIADEPTSGLDTTIAKRVLTTLRRSLEDSSASGIVVTHDLAVVANYCDRVLVMREGKVLEEAPVDRFFRAPKAEYSAQLISAHRWRDGDEGAEG